jgi:hypothetical protein
VLSVVFVALLLLFLPSVSRAVNIYYWFTPYGSTNLFATNTAPPNGSYVNQAVGPNYLGSHLLTNPGGIISSINATIQWPHPSQYCNYYRLPAMNRLGPDPIGNSTGMGVPSPVTSYQVQGSAPTSVYNSGCQAAQFEVGSRWLAGWGQHLNADDDGNDCSTTCGMNQSVIFGEATSNYPWSTAFAFPELTLLSEAKVHKYQTDGSPAGGWS